MNAIRRFLSALRVFKRLRELEAGAVLEAQVRNDADTALLAEVDRYVARFTACPHCGSVLDNENPGTSRPFVTGNGERLACWQCRPFLTKPLVRVSHPTEPIRNAKKGKR